jgi:hypothetical protein
MTLQDLFDQGLQAIRKQGYPGLSKDGVCRYRGSRGAKCVVGHLITDEEYLPEMEGKGADTIRLFLPDRLAEAARSGLLFQMQLAHDHSVGVNFLARFEDRMKWTAKIHRLMYTAPDGTVTDYSLPEVAPDVPVVQALNGGADGVSGYAKRIIELAAKVSLAHTRSDRNVLIRPAVGQECLDHARPSIHAGEDVLVEDLEVRGQSDQWNVRRVVTE